MFNCLLVVGQKTKEETFGLDIAIILVCMEKMYPRKVM